MILVCLFCCWLWIQELSFKSTYFLPACKAASTSLPWARRGCGGLLPVEGCRAFVVGFGCFLRENGRHLEHFWCKHGRKWNNMAEKESLLKDVLRRASGRVGEVLDCNTRSDVRNHKVNRKKQKHRKNHLLPLLSATEKSKWLWVKKKVSTGTTGFFFFNILQV